MANEPIDVAYVEIRPDTRGFGREAAIAIQRELARAATPVAPVDVEPDTRGFAAETRREIERQFRAIVPPSIRVDPATAGFGVDARREIERELAIILPPGVRLEPDTTGFGREARIEVERELRAITPDPTVDIDPDVRGFGRETQLLVDRELRNVQGNVAVGTPTVGGRGLGTTAVSAAATGLGAGIGSELGVERAEKQLRRYREELTSAAAGTALFGGTAARTGGLLRAGVIGPVGAAAAVLAGTGIVLGTSINTAIEFEDAFAAVRKTVEGSPAEIAALNEELKALSIEIPIATTELYAIAGAAGALGVETASIVDFTDTVAKLGVSTDLTADQAADALARIANVTDLPTDQFDNLGATLVDLGNNSAATESEIVDFGLRVARSGSQIGLTVGEVLGFSAALASIGDNAEAGGTAISQTFNKIETAVARGGKPLEKFASVAGVSADEFATQFKEAPAEAVLQFIEGLGRVKDEGGSLTLTLDDLGLSGIRVASTLKGLAGNTELVRTTVANGNTAFAENNALQDEAAKKFGTTASQIQLFKNNVALLQNQIGEALLPSVNDLIQGLSGLVTDLRESETAGALFSTVLDGLEQAWGPLAKAFTDNSDDIKDAFQDLAEVARKVLIATTPMRVLFGQTLGIAFRIAIKVITLAIDIVEKLADAWSWSVGIIVKAIDKFMGAIALFAEAAGRIPVFGDQFDEDAESINAAREELRAFADDFQGIDGEKARVEIEVALTGDAAAVGMTAPFGGNAISAAAAEAAALPSGASPGVTGGAGRIPIVQSAELPAALAVKNQRLQDELELARIRTESLADDRKALAALIAFSDEQAQNDLLKPKIRREFAIQAARARQELRDGYTAEREANRQAAEDAADAAKQRAEDARAEREAVLAANIQLAATTENTIADDVAALRVSIRYWRSRVDTLGRQTAAGKAALIELRAARKALNDVFAQERADRKAERDKRIADTEETLQDRLTLAGFTEGKDDDLKRLKALERFYGRRVRAAERFSKEQRKWRIKLRGIQKDIRDLNEEEAESVSTPTRSFAQATFDFMQRQQGFTSQYLSNLLDPTAASRITLSSEASPSGGGGALDGPGREFAGGRRGPSETLTTAQAQADKRGMTQGQANRLIALTQQLVDSMTDVKRGTSHPEAVGASIWSRSRQEIL